MHFFASQSLTDLAVLQRPPGDKAFSTLRQHSRSLSSEDELVGLNDISTFAGDGARHWRREDANMSGGHAIDMDGPGRGHDDEERGVLCV